MIEERTDVCADWGDLIHYVIQSFLKEHQRHILPWLLQFKRYDLCWSSLCINKIIARKNNADFLLKICIFHVEWIGDIENYDKIHMI